ncbi:efflux RND transporter periplasmic adaptor subunit [Pseudomonas mangiferae]|uniref:Efflux RND transporter periplasmic adaptor subunit n=1 Tax=Pseudomonas mangiferae TaxID=2593654 RepID=A0A553H1D7_9PSED|nr:efflux RND transporter periplasmic adaptor subunit [Pseudomonas mangiferae]TRX75542.1 efflux RND transporter periplasmic adaptor subunit [Pseudomonas mangiferae]
MIRHAPRVALSLAVSLLLVACSEPEPVTQAPRPVLVVHPQPAADAVESFSGEVRARFEPELAFRIGGKVARRLVEVGDRVKKDQPLAALDPQDVGLQLDASRAQLTAAEANLRLARAERERYRKLLDRQMISHSQYDTVENQYLAGEARLNQLRAEYNVAGNQAGYAVLRAPRDGVIASRNLEAGQVVAAGQTVFTLAVDGEREVSIAIPEHAVGRFRVGQAVVVELWSRPGQRFAAHLRELSPSADAQSRTFAARVAFGDGGIGAEPGQSARVFLQAEGDGVLSVPLSALAAEKGEPYVWVVQADATLHRAPVRVGAYGEERVPVLDGLKPDDWIVAAGVQVLREAQAVRPVDRDNRAVQLAAKE